MRRSFLRNLFGVAIAGSVLAWGCSVREEPQAGADGSMTTAEASRAHLAPSVVKQDTIRLEGMPERITVKSFDSASAGLPARFTTDVPADFLVDAAATSGGKSVRMVANFAGQRNDDVYLQIVSDPAGTTEADARLRVRVAADSRGRVARVDRSNRYMWSIVEEDFSRRMGNRRLLGTAALGKHANRYFHIVVQYESEYAEGFLPRVAYVLDHWRWADTGTSLSQS